MSKLSYVMTQSSVVVKMPSGNLIHLMKEHPLFIKLMDTLKQGLFDQVAGIFDAAALIKQHTNGSFWMKDGLVYHKGQVMPESLSKRVLAFAQQNLEIEPLIKFWENLCENPEQRSREHLFAFLDHNGIPITEDGCFIGYKRVRHDWTDCYTGKIDNSIGQFPEMPRSEVNPDPNETCSRGLHIAAWDYLPTMDHQNHNNRTVECKVHPKDVVAVPTDYNGQKMRVCRYEVIGENVKNVSRPEQLFPKYKEGQRVEVEQPKGYAEGTIEDVLTHADKMTEYIVVLDSGLTMTVNESNIALLDTSDTDAKDANSANYNTLDEDDEEDFEDEENFEEDEDDEEFEDDEEDDDDEVIDAVELNSRVENLEKGQTDLKKGQTEIKDALTKIAEELDKESE